MAIIGEGPKFYAVRVVIVWANKTSTQKDYVRGVKRLSEGDFDSFAVGDMIRLIAEGFFNSTQPINFPAITCITVDQISSVTVIENRRYHHTTH